MEDLTGFQRDLLRAVALIGEPIGLEIKSYLEEDGQYTEVNHGRLYPNLDTLVEKGLMHKGKKDDRTNLYSITRRGAREIEQYTAQWISAGTAVEEVL